jgi:hypothetical protein
VDVVLPASAPAPAAAPAAGSTAGVTLLALVGAMDDSASEAAVSPPASATATGGSAGALFPHAVNATINTTRIPRIILLVMSFSFLLFDLGVFHFC